MHEHSPKVTVLASVAATPSSHTTPPSVGPAVELCTDILINGARGFGPYYNKFPFLATSEKSPSSLLNLS